MPFIPYLEFLRENSNSFNHEILSQKFVKPKGCFL
jgi:hypothetical protein